MKKAGLLAFIGNSRYSLGFLLVKAPFLPLPSAVEQHRRHWVHRLVHVEDAAVVVVIAHCVPRPCSHVSSFYYLQRSLAMCI